MGKTNLVVSRVAVNTENLMNAVQSGAISGAEFADIIKCAYEGGINFFNICLPVNAPFIYADLNALLCEVRSSIRLSFLSKAKTGFELEREVQNALECFQIDSFDLYKIQDPGFIPVPNGEDGLYDALEKLRQSGKILHTGFVSDNLNRIKDIVFSDFYEAVLFPFNFLSEDVYMQCADICMENGLVFLADKPLAAGKIKNIPLAVGFFRRSEHALPLWKIKDKEELQQILYFEKNPPAIDEQFFKDLAEEKERLSLT